MPEFDLVIRGGDVIDGTGAPRRRADIAVSGERIVAIGASVGRGGEEIDARGLLVTPGFVDIHTHYDGQATWDACLAPSSWHGVTTAVMGNCGVGFAPVRPEDHARLIAVMEGVEDIPGAVLDEGLSWDWETFPQYLDALERRAHDIDFAAQLPHAALRIFVMGARAERLDVATNADIARMRALAGEAIRAGALGFSTSRTLNHRTRSGDPTPSLKAAEEELGGILAGVAEAGGGVFEMISDFDSPGPSIEFEMVRRLARDSGVPTSLSLAQVHHDPTAWRTLLDLIEGAAKEGLRLRGQVAPRPIGTLLGLQTSLNPFSAHPTYRALASFPLPQRVAALRDPDVRQRLLKETPQGRAAEAVQRFSDFDRVFPLGDPPDYEPAPECSVASRARVRGESVLETALDMLLEQNGEAFLFAPFSNFADGDLEACAAMIASEATIMGLGDGGAHVGMIADASFPTYLLTHWGRDRSRGRLPLEFLVRKQTWDTACAVGLRDRGRLEPGMKADLNLIDFEKLAVRAPRMVRDLPAGGRRLLQGADGYEATIVSGQITYRRGVATGALPGRLLRGARAA